MINSHSVSNFVLEDHVALHGWVLDELCVDQIELGVTSIDGVGVHPVHSRLGVGCLRLWVLVLVV